MTSGALELNGSSIVAADDGVLMEGGAQAIINGSTIACEDRGVVVARSSAGGSAAWLSGSSVTGKNGGAAIASTSELHLNGSTLQGTGPGSAGVRMFNGWLEAQVARSLVRRRAFWSTPMAALGRHGLTWTDHRSSGRTGPPSWWRAADKERQRRRSRSATGRN